MTGRCDAPAELRRHGLHAIADAEHRHTEREYIRRCVGRARVGHGLGAARQDDAARAECSDRRLARIPGHDLAIDAELAHTARDQLRVLRTKIEDQDAVRVDVARGGSARQWRSHETR